MENEIPDLHEGLSGEITDISEETANKIANILTYSVKSCKTDFEELAKSFEQLSLSLKELHFATGKLLIMQIRSHKGLKRLYYIWKLKRFRKKSNGKN